MAILKQKMNSYFNDLTEEFSSNLCVRITFSSENLSYENNDSFNIPQPLSEPDSFDNQELYFTNNNTERISEENTLNRSIILFDIKKVKHRGRKRKNQKSTKKSGHTEFTKDNIMIKIERDVLDSSKDFLNILIKETDNKKIKGLTLNKIDTSILNGKKEENERILKMPLKELFSHDISKKFKYFPKDYNKNIIDKILKQNDKVLNEALDTPFEYMIKLYSEEEKPENNIYNNFNTVTSNQKLLKEAPNYIKKYKNILQNFFVEFDKIIPRKKKQSFNSN